MRSIQDTLAIADECRRASNAQSTEMQREFYCTLHRSLLGIAAVKLWLHETKNMPERERPPETAPEARN
jgi:hypothetical protein